MSKAVLITVLGVTLVAAGAVVAVVALFKDRSRGRQRCPRCWYDMSAAVALTCPECGKTARSKRGLHRTRRRWRWAALGGLVTAGGIVTAGFSGVRASELWSHAPQFALRGVHRLYADLADELLSAEIAGTGSGKLTSFERMLVSLESVDRMEEEGFVYDPRLANTPVPIVVDCGVDALPVIPRLYQMLGLPDSRSEAAVDALGGLCSAVPNLRHSVAKRAIQDSEVRAGAIAALGKRGLQSPEEHQLAFEFATEDPDPEVRRSAVGAFGPWIGRNEYGRAAVVEAASDPSPAVRRAAAESLRFLHWSLPGITDAALKLLRDPDEETRIRMAANFSIPTGADAESLCIKAAVAALTEDTDCVAAAMASSLRWRNRSPPEVLDALRRATVAGRVSPHAYVEIAQPTAAETAYLLSILNSRSQLYLLRRLDDADSLPPDVVEPLLCILAEDEAVNTRGLAVNILGSLDHSLDRVVPALLNRACHDSSPWVRMRALDEAYDLLGVSLPLDVVYRALEDESAGNRIKAAYILLDLVPTIAPSERAVARACEVVRNRLSTETDEFVIHALNEAEHKLLASSAASTPAQPE